MFCLHRYKCNVAKVLSGQMNNIIESLISFILYRLYACYSSKFVVWDYYGYGRFFIIAYVVVTGSYRWHYIQCLCLGLVLSFTVFIVLIVCLSVMYSVYDFIINKNNNNNAHNFNRIKMGMISYHTVPHWTRSGHIGPHRTSCSVSYCMSLELIKCSAFTGLHSLQQEHRSNIE